MHGVEPETGRSASKQPNNSPKTSGLFLHIKRSPLQGNSCRREWRAWCRKRRCRCHTWRRQRPCNPLASRARQPHDSGRGPISSRIEASTLAGRLLPLPRHGRALDRDARAGNRVRAVADRRGDDERLCCPWREHNGDELAAGRTQWRTDGEEGLAGEGKTVGLRLVRGIPGGQQLSGQDRHTAAD